MILAISFIRTDGGTQSRIQLHADTITDYAERIGDGAVFPPVVVFYDGADHWLADGFHRVEAHRQAGRDSVEAEVKQGTKRDALLYAVGANATHGLRRSNADKRRAVMVML